MRGFRAVLIAAALFPGFAAAKCEKPWVFFDLGDTLVDTATHDYDPMFLVAGAAAYLESLAAAGHPVGLIADVPEEWGKGYPPEAPIKDAKTAKWVRLLDFISGKVPADKTSWKGKAFDPAVFGKMKGRGADRVFEGRVFLPMTDLERKDTGNPKLFERAKKMADDAGCGAMYMTEAADQVEWAKGAGLPSYRVGRGFAGQFYLPVERIVPFVEEARKAGCAGMFEPPPPSPTIVRRRRPRGF